VNGAPVLTVAPYPSVPTSKERSLSAAARRVPPRSACRSCRRSIPMTLRSHLRASKGIRSHRPDESGTAIRKRRASLAARAKAKGESANTTPSKFAVVHSTTSATSSSRNVRTTGSDQRVRDTLTRSADCHAAVVAPPMSSTFRLSVGGVAAEATLAPSGAMSARSLQSRRWRFCRQRLGCTHVDSSFEGPIGPHRPQSTEKLEELTRSNHPKIVHF